MIILTSKLQYEISERGEFHEIAKRNLDDGMQFTKIPWSEGEVFILKFKNGE